MTRRVLVFCEGIWLAHTARPLSIARVLRESGWDVHFAASGAYARLPREEGFPVHRVTTMDPERALRLIRSARIGYDLPTVELYLEDELTLIERLKPDVILNDFRLPVAISARLTGVPFVNILNAYWTNYYAPRLRAPREFILTRVLGVGFATRLLPPVQRLMLRLYARPFNTVASRRGTDGFGNIFDVMASPHLNLIADLEEFMPLAGAPDHFKYTGPIIWEPSVPAPDWLERIDPARPVIYFSMGSTGFAHYFSALGEAFGEGEYQVMVTTGGLDAGAMPPNFFVTDLAPGLALTEKADLVICHGGNGTIYQALYHGVPVIGIPSFHDQDFNMQRVEDLGLGKALDPRRLTPGLLREAADSLKGDADALEACRKISCNVRSADSAATAADLIAAAF
ncbi:MAG: glycosyltransferase [Planctomycetota bacterium]|jgi:MGT family glycosyltransferase